MNINDVVNDSVEMMEKVEKETGKMKEKLDGIIALIMALGEYYSADEGASVYEDRGLLLL